MLKEKEEILENI